MPLITNILTLTLACLAVSATSSSSSAGNNSSIPSVVQPSNTIPQVLVLAPANAVDGLCSCKSWEVANLGCVACNCNSCGTLGLKDLRESFAALGGSCLAIDSEKVVSRAGRQSHMAELQEHAPPSSGGFAVIAGPAREDKVRGFVAVYRAGDDSVLQRPDVGVKCVPPGTDSVHQHHLAASSAAKISTIFEPHAGTTLTVQYATASSAANEAKTIGSTLSIPATAGLQSTISHTTNGGQTVSPPSAAGAPFIPDKSLELEVEQLRKEVEHLQREVDGAKYKRFDAAKAEQPSRWNYVKAARDKLIKVFDKLKSGVKKVWKKIFVG